MTADWEELRQSLATWLQAALSILDARVADGRPLPARIRFELDVRDDGYGGQSVTELDVRALVESLNPQLRALIASEAVLKIVRASTAAASALLVDGASERIPADREMTELLSRYLEPLLAEHVSRSGSAEFSPETFVDLAGQFEEFIYRFDGMPFTWLVLFRNLRMEIGVVDLGDGVRLRRATPVEQQRAYEGSPEVGLMLGMVARRRISSDSLFPTPDYDAIPRVVLEIPDSHRLPRYSLSEVKAQEYADRAVRALRLVGTEWVDGHSIWFVDSNPFQRISGPRHSIGKPRGNFAAERPFVVTMEMAEELCALWPALAEAPDDRVVALALRRFEDSYDRRRPDDRLLDLWIALEALFLGGEKDELSFRAAMNIARYLGESPEDRERLFALVKRSYALRSTIVHGQDPKPKQNLDGTVAATDSLLRASLCRALVAQHAPDLDALRRDMFA